MAFDPKDGVAQLAAGGKGRTKKEGGRGAKTNSSPDRDNESIVDNAPPNAANATNEPPEESVVSPADGEDVPPDGQQGASSEEIKTTEPPRSDKPAPPEPPTASVLIEVPIGTVFPDFASPRIDFSATPRQAAAAKMLWCSLTERSARFDGGRTNHPNGKVVEGPNDGVRWLLDRLADAIENEMGKNLLTDFRLKFR